MSYSNGILDSKHINSRPVKGERGPPGIMGLNLQVQVIMRWMVKKYLD